MLVILLQVCALMHPYHITYAEAQWDAESGRLQVALRVLATDLDAALSNSNDKRIVLEKLTAEEKRDLIVDYLGDQFFLADEEGEPKNSIHVDKSTADRRKRFHWVGVEENLRYTWIYFELDKPERAEKLWLVNRVFIEIEPTQINTVEFLKTRPAVVLTMTKDQPLQPIPLATVVDKLSK